MNNMTFPQLLSFINLGGRGVNTPSERDVLMGAMASAPSAMPAMSKQLGPAAISQINQLGISERGVSTPQEMNFLANALGGSTMPGLLESILGTGVQGAMEGANVGARGLDTPNERDFLRESFGESYRTKDSEYQKALGKMLGEQAGERDAPINFGVDGLGPALSGYKGGESNRGVPSQREMDTLMQILQTGR